MVHSLESKSRRVAADESPECLVTPGLAHEDFQPNAEYRPISAKALTIAMARLLVEASMNLIPSSAPQSSPHHIVEMGTGTSARGLTAC